MNIALKINCKSLVGPLTEGKYSVPDGLTVQGVLEYLAQQKNYTFDDFFFPWTFALINGNKAEWDALVSNGDRIYILAVVMGG